jgi:hypothetical protein
MASTDKAGIAPIMTLKGVNGQLEVYENKVTIKRKGALAKMTQGFFAGEKDIFYRQMGSVKVKWGGMLTNGFIQFAPTGGIERKRGLTKQTQDENTVRFSTGSNDLVGKIKDYAEQQMARSMTQGAGEVGKQASLADELKKFADLRASGIISEDEFQAQKNKLLGG